MKKLITVCLLMATTLTIKAQGNLTQLKSDIIDELDKEEKVYTPSGSYNRIFYYKFIGDNLLQVRQFSGIIRSGERETSDVISITIDMTKVTGVFSNKTNFGYKCIVMYGGDYVFNIQYKNEGEYEWSDIEYKTEITLASDNKELIRLFQEWSQLQTKN